MSEADNTWRVVVDGVDHEIEVNHSSMTGKIVVKLDGSVIGEDRLWFNAEKVGFDVGSTTAEVTVDTAYGGFSARSALHVGGRYVEPLRR